MTSILQRFPGAFARALARKLPQRLRGAILLGLVLAPGAASAFDLHGRVVNGTTGEPLAATDVTIVNPSGGMMVENEAKTDGDGRFVVTGLDESRPVFLIRVPFQGVNYTDFIRFQGQNPVEKTVDVYDVTTASDEIRVSIPQMLVSRDQDTLTVEKYFQVTNEKRPPRTMAGDDGRFKFYLPGDITKINSFQVMSMGVPLPVTPAATDAPGIYTIDYPIKPGVTQIAMSFDLPYGDSQYEYRETFPYGLDEMIIATEDPSLQIASGTTTLERLSDTGGAVSYRVAALEPETSVQVTFAGGTDRPTSRGRASSPQIFVLPTANNAASIVIMVVLTVGLIVVLAYVVSQPRSHEIEDEVLSERREQLLDQLARLDDLYKAGTVSDQMYKLKRSELTSALAQIYYRLKFAKTTDSPRAKREKGSARV